MQMVQNLKGEQGSHIIEDESWSASKPSEVAVCARAITEVSITDITQPDVTGGSRAGDTVDAGDYIWCDITAIEVTGKLQLFFGSKQLREA